MSRYNVRLWELEKQRKIVEHERDSFKLNVFCVVFKEKMYKPFFYENTVTETSYLQMIKDWLFPQQQFDRDHFILQQDEAPPQWYLKFRKLFNDKLLQRWIGRLGANNAKFCSWPPRSPVYIICDFFL